LQELLAPASAVFLNKYWDEIGTKSSLAKELSSITKIPTRVLLREEGEDFSVAQVMSWAANRKTTRLEDIGYCLLGIFGVNMPMIYGEGEKAFLRLQQEIIKGSADQSLFAWTRKTSYGEQFRHQKHQGAFARSPADFVGCGNVVQTDYGQNPEFTLTNKGLCIEVELVPSIASHALFTAYLNCTIPADGSRLGILLRRINDDQFIRTDLQTIRTYPSPLDKRDESKIVKIYITEPGASSISISRWIDNFPEGGSFTFILSKVQWSEQGFLKVGKAHCPPLGLGVHEYRHKKQREKYIHSSGEYVVTHRPKGASAFKFQLENTLELSFVVVFGVTSNYRVWSDIHLETGSDKDLPEILRSYYEIDEGSLHFPRTRRRVIVRDRITVLLEDGSAVNVALKKVLVSGKGQYKVNITIT
jgi:hypothetical protein